MNACVVFGGAGYIGTKLIQHFLDTNQFECIYVADIKDSALKDIRINHLKIDVRNTFEIDSSGNIIDWIFNFAAIHREPGHAPKEYYETNIPGAKNVCDYATKTGCQNIFFTSSISVYGPTLKPTDEDALTTPNTPYGISKLTAEYIHKVWVEQENGRRLMIVRPGVIFGPGDPGNILRMIRAIKKGYFFLPVSPTIRKSYGYIYGLIDSIEFMMKRKDKSVTYNYVEKDTESLGEMISTIKETLGFKGRIIRIPFFLLKVTASLIHTVMPNLNGIHPERVKKVARPTHILPKALIDQTFTFRFNLRESLIHWKKELPEDF